MSDDVTITKQVARRLVEASGRPDDMARAEVHDVVGEDPIVVALPLREFTSHVIDMVVVLLTAPLSEVDGP